MIVNLNGQFVECGQEGISICDGAFLYGDTLFETIKATGQTIRLLKEHLDRIESSARILEFPFSRPDIEAALHATAQRLAVPNARLRLTISRGPFSGLSFPDFVKGYFVITAQPWKEPSALERSNGVDCVFAPNRRVNVLTHLPQMKRGNYADCLYASNYARQQNAREALFVHVDETVLEGASSNIFIIRSNCLVTPPLGDLILPGVMRHMVLQVGRKQGMCVEERPIPVAELFEADEVFLTNALVEILPVASIAQKAVARGLKGEALRMSVRREIGH